MKQVPAVSLRTSSGRTASLRVDHELGQYVLKRCEGDDVVSFETFTTKRELEFFLGRPNCSKDEYALEALLLEAQFFPREIPSELATIFSEYPEGLILIGHAAVVVHDNQVYRVSPWGDYLYLEIKVPYDQFLLMCERESILTVRGFEWDEMSRDSSSTQLYPYDQPHAIAYHELKRHALVIDGIRVPAKEHLLALTLDAAKMRDGGSSDDRKDIIALVLRMSHPNSELLERVLDEDRLTILRSIAKHSEIFEEMFERYPGSASELMSWFKDRIVRFENIVDYIALRDRQISNRHLRSSAGRILEGETSQSVPLASNLDRLPVGTTDAAFDDSVTTIRALCEAAGVRFRYSAGDVPSVVLAEGSGNLRAFDARKRPVYVVDRTQFTAETRQEEALRILEVIAYSFDDDVVRLCIHGLIQ